MTMKNPKCLVRLCVGVSLPVLLIVAGPRPGSAQRPAEGQARPAAAPADPADDDEREFRRDVAKAAVRDNCLICHSEEMVFSQRLTPAQWKAEVTKMVGWGSPLPADQVAPVIEFLSEACSDSTPAPTPRRMKLAQALVDLLPTPSPPGAHAGDPAVGAKVFAAQCATCHGPIGQGADLGPNLVETPVLRRPAEFSEVIEKGRRRMPGFRATVSRDQDADILAWLRQQQFVVPVVR